MYHSTTSLAATGGAGVFAGTASIWWALAAFAMIAAGSAIMRIVPRRTDRD